MKTITHQEFVNEYNAGKIQINVDKFKAGDFISSSYANKHKKTVYLLWSWLAIIMIIPLPIIILFYHWYYSVILVILGLIIFNVNRKSSGKLVIENMIESNDFWDYILLHGGAKIIDKILKITDKDIEEAVLEGARTLEDVQKKTKAGVQDKSCIPEIEQLIRFYTEKYLG